jgi:hypothetical protein
MSNTGRSVVLLALGLLALLAVATAPYLPGPKVIATGDFVNLFSRGRSINFGSYEMPIVLWLPLAAAAITLLSLILTLLRRRPLLALIGAYVATAGSLLVFTYALTHLELRRQQDRQFQEQVESLRREKPALTGAIEESKGVYFWVYLVAAGTAPILLILGTTFMHREIITRSLFLIVFLALSGFAAAVGFLVPSGWFTRLFQ